MSESHPRYVPPHKRGLKKEMGDEVVVAAKEHVDVKQMNDTQGLEHRHSEKLLIRVPYALTKAVIGRLSSAWPGMFFASSGPNNHDHPVAHTNTMVSTRIMQRMFAAGSRILDIFGSPNSNEAFNSSQSKARNPKHATTLVNKNCPADFIREVNKWGPRTTVKGNVRYVEGGLLDFDDEFYTQFDQLQMVHTLYYVEEEWLCRALHVDGGPKRALALVHRHEGTHGFLNGGEQEYWVRGDAVKQKNVSSGSVYYHRNITPFWFSERKEWYSDHAEMKGKGLAWEVHYMCPGSWVIEIVPIEAAKIDPDAQTTDWEQRFRSADSFEGVNVEPSPPRKTMLPLPDGKVVELVAENQTLLNALDRRAVGKPRTGPLGKKLFDDLVQTATHLVHPGALFPDKEPLDVAPHQIIDHVISAFVNGVDRELTMADAVSVLRPILFEHAVAVKSGFRSYDRMDEALDILRSVLPVVRTVLPETYGKTVASLGTMLDDAFKA